MPGEEEAKSSRETSMPTSFVFPTIQFTRVHLHLRYFHSNSRGAIRSIFDIGTWLWRRSCDFSLNRLHDKKGSQGPPSLCFAVTLAFFTHTFTSFFNSSSSTGTRKTRACAQEVSRHSIMLLFTERQRLRDVFSKSSSRRWRENCIRNVHARVRDLHKSSPPLYVNQL